MSDDLAAWLTQIWDEEERLAKRAGDALTAPEIDNYGHLTVPSGWMMARIAADRQILELHTGDNDDPCQEGNWVYVPCPTLRLLAQPYADRPGYQESWRLP